MDQLAPTDDIRLSLVVSDPDVQRAFELVRGAHFREREALKAATQSPEAAALHARALQVSIAVEREVLEPAILAAERRRKLRAAAPDCAAMAAAAKQPLDLDTRVALETVLRRKPAAKDAALWRTRGAGAVGYLVAALNREVQHIQAAREGVEAIASERDVAVYQFVNGRPRGHQRAPEWWAALLGEWNLAHPDSVFSTVRAFQNAFRRGRKAETEHPFDDARAVAALEQHAADHQAARETLDDLVAAAGLTPLMRATLAAELGGEDVTRSRRQDLVAKLRKTAAKKV